MIFQKNYPIEWRYHVWVFFLERTYLVLIWLIPQFVTYMSHNKTGLLHIRTSVLHRFRFHCKRFLGGSWSNELMVICKINPDWVFIHKISEFTLNFSWHGLISHNNGLKLTIWGLKPNRHRYFNISAAEPQFVMTYDVIIWGYTKEKLLLI